MIDIVSVNGMNVHRIVIDAVVVRDGVQKAIDRDPLSGHVLAVDASYRDELDIIQVSVAVF